MAMTESQKKYEKKRALQCKTYAIKYTPKEKAENDRLQFYLNKSGMSANAYIKELVKKDLDEKGIDYLTESDTEE